MIKPTTRNAVLSVAKWPIQTGLTCLALLTLAVGYLLAIDFF